MGWNDFLIAIGIRSKDEPPIAEPTAGAPAAGATSMLSGMKDRFTGVKDSVKNSFSGVQMKNPFAGGPGIDWGSAAYSLFKGGRKSMKQSKSRKQGKSRKQRETRK